MKLITPELIKRFAEIGSQENNPDPIVVAKFFNPAGAGRWFATEYHIEDNTCFGYASIFGDGCDEWGYFSIDELESLKLPFGSTIERDLYCGEKPISQFNIPSLKQ